MIGRLTGRFLFLLIRKKESKSGKEEPKTFLTSIQYISIGKAASVGSSFKDQDIYLIFILYLSSWIVSYVFLLAPKSKQSRQQVFIFMNYISSIQ